MDRKKLVLLACALIVAIGTALVARSMFAGAAAPEAQAATVPSGPKVLVAQRALPVGTIITADSLGFQQWPAELVRDAYFIEGESDISTLLGTVVRHPVTAGEPVTQGSLVSPGDRGFLAAALTPGMRAITVPVDARTGVAGFIFPGDRVDMVLTQTVEGTEGQSLKASETIIRNLRVLATDQATDQETAEGKTVVRTSTTVTLEATPKIAEKIAVAQTIGTLSFTLRSLADNSSELERALAAGNVVIPDDATPQEEERLLREAMARPDDGRSTFATGADVSRFQRGTMPSQTPRQETQTTAPAAPGDPSPASRPVRRGPTVTVTRGKEAEEVPVGTTRTSANTILNQQSAGMAKGTGSVPGAAATLR
ncbi:Flp pilus assembly protein CpaB [Qipengyuania sp. MTN3-11]|uniref:Flp pilus assembly protein CpaB n=1 Tax=Qipengyuania sp. MTN3-11 TaxID=3056557 RepID=UPI0036F21819